MASSEMESKVDVIRVMYFSQTLSRKKYSCHWVTWAQNPRRSVLTLGARATLGEMIAQGANFGAHFGNNSEPSRVFDERGRYPWDA